MLFFIFNIEKIFKFIIDLDFFVNINHIEQTTHLPIPNKINNSVFILFTRLGIKKLIPSHQN